MSYCCTLLWNIIALWCVNKAGVCCHSICSPAGPTGTTSGGRWERGEGVRGRRSSSRWEGSRRRWRGRSSHSIGVRQFDCINDRLTKRTFVWPTPFWVSASKNKHLAHANVAKSYLARERRHAFGNRARHRETNLITFSGREAHLINDPATVPHWSSWLVFPTCLDSVVIFLSASVAVDSGLNLLSAREITFFFSPFFIYYLSSFHFIDFFFSHPSPDSSLCWTWSKKDLKQVVSPTVLFLLSLLFMIPRD